MLLGLSGVLNGVVLVMSLNVLRTRVGAAVGTGVLFGVAGGVFLLAGLGGLLVPDLVGLE